MWPPSWVIAVSKEMLVRVEGVSKIPPRLLPSSRRWARPISSSRFSSPDTSRVFWISSRLKSAMPFRSLPFKFAMFNSSCSRSSRFPDSA